MFGGRCFLYQKPHYNKQSAFDQFGRILTKNDLFFNEKRSFIIVFELNKLVF
jgi:hypothetical protein